MTHFWFVFRLGLIVVFSVVWKAVDAEDEGLYSLFTLNQPRTVLLLVI